jgi:hypothetical protein
MDLCQFHSLKHERKTQLHVASPWCKPLVKQSSLRQAHTT